MKRVVITGAGTVNALGRDLDATWSALIAGRSAIRAVEFRDHERLQIKIGAQIRDWRPEQLFKREELALFDRFTQFAVQAADQAVAMAGVTPPSLSGVIIGTAAGGISTWEDNYRLVFEAGQNRVPPLTVPRLMSNAAGAHIAMRYQMMGPNFTTSSACSSSNHAIGLAFHMVRSGMAPMMLAGGAEAMLCFGGIKAWESLRVLSPQGCFPFAKGRSGMVMGEGAAVFVLEEREAALARGANILAEIIGFGMSADASHIVAPSVEGAGLALRNALQDANISSQDVDYINAHGTGTLQNDQVECQAITAVFGTQAKEIAISSTKAAHGHAIGAAGALELLAVILALKKRILAPTAHTQVPDPECDLDIIFGQARQVARCDVALSNSFAFGGLNAVLALRAG